MTAQRTSALGTGAAVARVASILAIPSGFTVTLWSAGTLAIVRLGLPSAADVVLFATGAAVAFVGSALLSRRHLDAEVPMRVPALIVVNLFPVLVALIVSAIPVASLGRHAGFFSTGFLATGAYVLSLALFIRVLTNHPGKEAKLAEGCSRNRIDNGQPAHFGIAEPRLRGV